MSKIWIQASLALAVCGFCAACGSEPPASTQDGKGRRAAAAAATAAGFDLRRVQLLTPRADIERHLSTGQCATQGIVMTCVYKLPKGDVATIKYNQDRVMSVKVNGDLVVGGDEGASAPSK